VVGLTFTFSRRRASAQPRRRPRGHLIDETLPETTGLGFDGLKEEPMGDPEEEMPEEPAPNTPEEDEGE
jgi:hypothetical protein